jgi:hypothetical protein
MCEQFVKSDLCFIGVSCIGQPCCDGQGKLFVRLAEEFEQQQGGERFAGTSPWHESVTGEWSSGGRRSESCIKQRYTVDGHIDLQSGMQSPGYAILECSNNFRKSLQICEHY